MINLIKINKFRAFSAPCEISLTPFTLLYGVNGVGKSSILESIELCMSGAISRTDASNIPNTIEEIRTVGCNEGLSIQLFNKNNEIVCEFNDNGPSLSFPPLLEKFYHRQAHHKTAQSLLKTLFATHNLLTQEKIVRLLDADSKEDFDTITKQMVGGSELVERWDKFQRLSDAVLKTYNEIMETEDRLKNELASIETSTKSLYTVQEKDMIQKSHDIYKTLMGIYLKNIYKPQDTDLKELLKWIQDTAIIIKEIRSVTQGVKEQAQENVLDLNKIQNLIDQFNKLLSETSELIEKFKKEIEDLKYESHKTSESCIEKKAKLRNQDTLLENLNAISIDMHIIKVWRSELLADFISKNLKKERDALSLKLNRYNKASFLIGQLPSLQQLDMGINTLHILRNDYDVKKQTRDALESEAKQKILQIKKLKDDFSSFNQSKNTLIAHYEHLNSLVENIFTIRPSLSVCPTCGTRFSDTQILMAKIRENITALRNSEGSIPEMFRAIPVIDEQLMEIQQKISSLNEMIQNNYNSLRTHEEQIQSWYKTADQLKQTLTTIQIPGIENHNKIDLREFCNYARLINLNAQQQELQSTINNLDARLSEQWHGLRKVQFLEQEPVITEKLENVPELKTVLGDAVLFAIKIEEAEQRIKQLTEARVRNKCELDGLLVQTENLKGQVEAKQTKLNELRIQKSEQEVKLKEQINLLSSANEINSFFITLLPILNLEDLQKKINSISAHIEGFETSLVVLLQSLNKNKEYEKRKIDIAEQRKQNQKKLLFINQTKKRIESVTPLETRLRNEWQQYKTYINDLFLKLQTPPDFSEIKLHDENFIFDLRVVSRVAGNDDKSAKVLSSGQRAALAISIFWTMNLYGAYSPPLMLMDDVSGRFKCRQ